MPGTREIEMLDLADLEMLGSFSGDVAWSSRLDGITTSRTINSAVDWQKVFLSHVLQQPSAASVPTLLIFSIKQQSVFLLAIPKFLNLSSQPCCLDSVGCIIADMLQ